MERGQRLSLPRAMAFAADRRRPLDLRPGVGHAVAAGAGLIVPVAVEYPFWNERLPEAVVAFLAVANVFKTWGVPALTFPFNLVIGMLTPQAVIETLVGRSPAP